MVSRDVCVGVAEFGIGVNSSSSPLPVAPATTVEAYPSYCCCWQSMSSCKEGRSATTAASPPVPQRRQQLA